MEEMKELIHKKAKVLHESEESILRKQYFSKFTQTTGCKTKDASSQIEEPQKDKK